MKLLCLHSSGRVWVNERCYITSAILEYTRSSIFNKPPLLLSKHVFVGWVQVPTTGTTNLAKWPYYSGCSITRFKFTAMFHISVWPSRIRGSCQLQLCGCWIYAWGNFQTKDFFDVAFHCLSWAEAGRSRCTRISRVELRRCSPVAIQLRLYNSWW